MNDQQFENTEEISLIDLFNILKNNLIMIVLSTFLVGIIAGIYAFVIADPQYKSNAYMMVEVQVGGTTNYSFDLVTAQRLVSTATEVASMPVVLEKVAQDLNIGLTASQIKSNLTVSFSSTSYFINVSYLSEDPMVSKIVVDEVIDETIAYANSNIAILENYLIRTSSAKEGVYDSPNRPLYVLIGFILGGILGVGIAFIKEMFDNTFRTKEQLENAFNLQVLGTIPEFEVKETK